MGYRKEIDGLRAIAVLAVIIAHTGVGWLPGGWAGVDIFFVISGFLITGIIQRDLVSGTFRFREFYARRVRRIFPALFAMLLVTTVAAWWLMIPSELTDYSASAASTLLFLSNFYFMDFVGYFAPSAETVPLLHTWSLAVEEQFYLFFPLLAWGSWRLAGQAGLWVCVAVLAGLSFGLAEWGWRNEPEANYFFSPSRFWEILAGGLVALAVRGRARRGSGGLAWGGVAMMGLSFLFYDPSTPFPSVYAVLPVAGAVLVLAFAPEKAAITALLSLPPVRGIGLISFSAYLWHQPVFAFARLEGVDTSDWRMAAPMVLAVLAVSYLSWRFVEQPFRFAGAEAAWGTRHRGAILSVTAAVVFAVSLAGYFTDLPVKRYNADDARTVEVSRLEARSYNRGVRKGLMRRAFDPQSDAPKVAVVGDSFARDFLNILAEDGVLEEIDLSLWTIGHLCAPFFLSENDARIDRILAERDCSDWDRYESAAMRQSLGRADVILLASNWAQWHVGYVAETVRNLRALSSARIVLVGPKYFGAMTVRDVLRVAAEDRPDLRAPVGPEKRATNDGLAGIEGVDQYIDLFRAVCDGGARCPVVDETGRMISLDGVHLTPAGAAFLARLLSRELDLRAVFERVNRPE